LIVDDVEVTRQSLRRLLGFEADFEVVGEADSGRKGVEIAKRLQPNIVLMDINMPDMDGIEATAQLFKAAPRVAVVVVSVQADPAYVRRSMLAGARSFLTKPVDMNELYQTIREVHAANQLRL
jgi:pilus assembly protein CpaE